MAFLVASARDLRFYSSQKNLPAWTEGKRAQNEKIVCFEPIRAPARNERGMFRIRYRPTLGGNLPSVVNALCMMESICNKTLLRPCW